MKQRITKPDKNGFKKKKRENERVRDRKLCFFFLNGANKNNTELKKNSNIFGQSLDITHQ